MAKNLFPSTSDSLFIVCIACSVPGFICWFLPMNNNTITFIFCFFMKEHDLVTLLNSSRKILYRSSHLSSWETGLVQLYAYTSTDGTCPYNFNLPCRLVSQYSYAWICLYLAWTWGSTLVSSSTRSLVMRPSWYCSFGFVEYYTKDRDSALIVWVCLGTNRSVIHHHEIPLVA